MRTAFLNRYTAGVAVALFLSALAGCVSAAQDAGTQPVARSPTTIDRVILPGSNAATPASSAAPTGANPGDVPVGLENELFDLWRGFPGKTGIAVKRIDGTWETAQRGDDLFPQQSISKLWVAMTILDMIDQGTVRLDERLTIAYPDLAVFHSPIRDRVVARGTVDESVLTLLEDAVIGSDNTANDRLMWRAGGPDAVRAFIASRNLGAIRFGPGERLLQSGIAGLEWDQNYAIGNNFFAARAALPYGTRETAINRYIADPVDGASPLAIARALDRLARGELLSGESTQRLLGIMARTKTGPNRLKAGLPAGWAIAHKTGTGQVLDSVATGYNDVGIVTAPDGTRYAVVVLLGDTTAGVTDRMRLMQAVSSAVVRYHFMQWEPPTAS